MEKTRVWEGIEKKKHEARKAGGTSRLGTGNLCWDMHTLTIVTRLKNGDPKLASGVGESGGCCSLLP